MAELTTLEEKRGEVLGLAQAAQGATEKIEDEEVAGVLARMREEAEATEMMSTYLGDDADGLDGFEFLTMAEAGEVGHWAVLGTLNEQAGQEQLSELVRWALPIQERHFDQTKECSLRLAAEEDPYE